MFNTIEEAISDIKKGKMIIVVDDEDRENEGDLLMAAQMVEPEDINFMAQYGRGLICLPSCGKRLDQLGLKQMTDNNTDPYETAFTVSIDHADTTTGISAFERAYTVKKFLDKDAGPLDFKKPGHIFPLRAKENGVLCRKGHTEAAVDLARLAGCYPAGLICEIMREDGKMARLDDLLTFKEEHQLKLVKIDDLIAYRKKKECLVRLEGQAKLPTEFGDFQILGFENDLDKKEHLALIKGDIKTKVPLVRIHSECLTGDALFSRKCDCGQQLRNSMKAMEKEGAGIIIYLRQEGRNIGLLNKIKAYQLQDQGLNTVEANLALGLAIDNRDYTIAHQILSYLGLEKIRLISNNPEKIKAMEEVGIEVERVEIKSKLLEENKNYIKTKKEELGHLLSI